MKRALLIAIGILLAASAMGLAAIQLGVGTGVLFIAFWVAPPAAALVAACVAPRQKLLVALLTALPAALLNGATNYVFEAMGHAVDFPGTGGALLVMGMSLPVVALLCIIAGAVGYLATRNAASA